MSVLLPLGLLACLLAAAMLHHATPATGRPGRAPRRRTGAHRAPHRPLAAGRAHRRAAWRGQHGPQRPPQPGPGMLLAAPAFGLCVLAGVLLGEATAGRPTSTSTRTAVIETRRARDYLPLRLAGMVAVLAGMLALLLAATSWSATSDDLGHAGRALRQVCDQGMVAVASPWPGAFYSAPLALTVAAGLLVATLVLHRVVRRPCAGVEAEPRALDDALRQRTAQTITSACGILIAVPLVGAAIVVAARLLSVPCAPTWARGGWLGAAGCGAWRAGGVGLVCRGAPDAGPPSPPAHHRARPR
jgi:hypothetical protein